MDEKKKGKVAPKKKSKTTGKNSSKEENEDEQSYQGILPERDLKKNLGCG